MTELDPQAERVGTAAAIPGVATPPREVGSGLWYLQLLFAPTSFFQRYALRPPAVVVAAAAVIVGIVRTMERVDRQLMKADLGASDFGAMAFVLDSWPGYWLWCVGIGALVAVLVAYLGGWWYRVRLGWSGAVAPDAALARRVYLLSYQVEAVPALLYALWGTLMYASPREAWLAADEGALLLLPFAAWSILASYKGACACFDVSPSRALLWFAILPALLVALAFASIVAAYVILG